MRLRFRAVFTSRLIFLVRILLVVFAGIAIWWGTVEMSIFARESSIERIGRHIIEGEPFKGELLIGQLPHIESAEDSADCRPSATQSAAIIRLRIAENEISSGNKSQVNEALNSLRSSIRKSLSCSPADPFLWLVYYWVQSTQYGRTSEELESLRMSYQLGPNEGWIGLRRNRIAFAIFEQLPPDLAESAINEFVGLLETSRLYKQVAEIFVGPAWHVRNVILTRLNLLSDRDLAPFVKAVHRLGREVNLPGVDKSDRRPWE